VWGDSRYERRGVTTRRSQYLLLGGLLGLRRLLLFLATFFRGALGSRTLLLGCLRGHALGRGWLVRVLRLEHLRLRRLWLLRLEGALALWGLLLLLEGALALQGLLLLEGRTLPL